MPTATKKAPAKKKADSWPEGLKEFFLPLHRTFEARRQELLAARANALNASHQGNLPNYLPESEATKGKWRIALPEWGRDQRNQITGPADNPKLLVGMCN